MTDYVGFIACGLVLMTFSMTSMIWLRFTAIASNIAFVVYGAMVDLPPIWLLHAILLPLNCWRLRCELLAVGYSFAGRERAGTRPIASADDRQSNRASIAGSR